MGCGNSSSTSTAQGVPISNNHQNQLNINHNQQIQQDQSNQNNNISKNQNIPVLLNPVIVNIGKPREQQISNLQKVVQNNQIQQSSLNGKTVVIKSVMNRKVLEIAAMKTPNANLGDLIIQVYNGSFTQQFEIQQFGQEYEIKIKRSGKVLDADGINSKKIVQKPRHGALTQKWKLISEGNSNQYFIKNSFTNKVLELGRIDVPNGTPINQSIFNYSHLQKWIIEVV